MQAEKARRRGRLPRRWPPSAANRNKLLFKVSGFLSLFLVSCSPTPGDTGPSVLGSLLSGRVLLTPHPKETDS